MCTVGEVVPSGWRQLAPATTQVQFNPRFYPLQTGPTSTAIADFDGDGKLDFVATNLQDPHADLSVFFGNGDGTFGGPSTPTDFKLPTHGAISVVAIYSDYGGKLLPDLAVLTSSGTVYLLPNNGAKGPGGFTVRPGLTFSIPSGMAPLQMIAGDFNGRGVEDLAITYKAEFACRRLLDLDRLDGRVLPAIAARHDGERLVKGVSTPGAMATGDINGDGKVDPVLVAGASPNSLSVVFGDGARPVREHGHQVFCLREHGDECDRLPVRPAGPTRPARQGERLDPDGPQRSQNARRHHPADFRRPDRAGDPRRDGRRVRDAHRSWPMAWGNSPFVPSGSAIAPDGDSRSALPGRHSQARNRSDLASSRSKWFQSTSRPRAWKGWPRRPRSSGHRRSVRSS